MQSRTIDFGKALSFMFDDSEWMKKFLIGVGLVIAAIPLAFLFVIPAMVPIFILSGYSIEISRRVAQNHPTILPEWSDWSKYLKDGALVTVAAIAYSLPLMVPLFGLICAMIATADSSGEASGIVALMGACVTCLSILYIIPLYGLIFGGLIEYLRTGQVSSFFAFRNMQAWKSGSDGNPRKNFILVLLVILLPLGLAGSAIPVLGSVWAMFAQGHLLGQILQQTGYEQTTTPPPGMVNSI